MALRRAQYAEIREIDRTIPLDSLAILEQVMRHFYWKARILEGMGTVGDFNEVDKAWAETSAAEEGNPGASLNCWQKGRLIGVDLPDMIYLSGSAPH
jgi:hypothetical protein